MTRMSARLRPGETWRSPLERLLVGRRPRLDDQVADAHRLDHRHHLLLRAGADREHRHHRGDAEDHAEHGQQRAQLVREAGCRRPWPASAAGRGRSPADLHGWRSRARHAPVRSPPDDQRRRRPRRDGSASAISVPSATPSTTAASRSSPTTLTGVGVKPCRRRGRRPPCRRRARRRRRAARAARRPAARRLIVTRPVSPGRRSAAGASSDRVAENIRDRPAAPRPKNRCGMMPADRS